MNHKDEAKRLRKRIAVLEEELKKHGIKIPEIETTYADRGEIIFSIVCDVCRISKEKILSKARPDFIVWPRQLIAYFCYEYDAGSYQTIANFLNRTEHGTIMFAHKKIRELSWVPGTHLDQFKECKKQIELALGLTKQP